jgi:hypothetical protein
VASFIMVERKYRYGHVGKQVSVSGGELTGPPGGTPQVNFRRVHHKPFSPSSPIPAHPATTRRRQMAQLYGFGRTSNQAERDLRPAKTQEKISGRLQSETTTSHRYAIRGYLSTAAKHRTDVLTALRDALTGTPGCHPSPTASNPRPTPGHNHHLNVYL